MKRIGAMVLLLAGSIALALAMAELGLRIVRPAESDDVEIQAMNQFDALLGWRKKPAATDTLVTKEYRIVESTNSRGLRGPEYPLEKPKGTRRVLVLGDSFAEGYTVNFGELCSEVLASLLNQPGSERYEVINAGTAGYSTDQELLYYQHEGREYRPDVTVVLFYVNDVWYNDQTRYWRGQKPHYLVRDGKLELTNVPVPPPDPAAFAFEVAGGSGITRWVRRGDAWLGKHSALYRLTRLAMRNSPALHSVLVKLGFADVPGEFRPWHQTTDPVLARAWNTTERLLVELRDQTRADGGQLMVFHVPPRPAVYPDDWQLTLRTYAMPATEWSPRQDEHVLREICTRNNLDCVFPADRFAAEAVRLGAVGERLYFRQDAHWTPQGHNLAGRLMAEHLLAGTAKRP